MKELVLDAVCLTCVILPLVVGMLFPIVAGLPTAVEVLAVVAVAGLVVVEGPGGIIALWELGGIGTLLVAVYLAFLVGEVLGMTVRVLLPPAEQKSEE